MYGKRGGFPMAAGGFVIILSLVILFSRERFAETIVEYQNSTWGFRFTEKTKKVPRGKATEKVPLKKQRK